MMKHEKTHKLEAPFECELCGIELDEHGELCEHKMHHFDRPHFECLECDYVGTTPKLLWQHMRTHVSQ